MHITLPFLLALAAVVQAQQASSSSNEPNLMDMILAPITSNIKHAIPVNTIPQELAAPNTVTVTANTTEEASPASEAAVVPVQEESAPEVAQKASAEVAQEAPEKKEEPVAISENTEGSAEPVLESEAAVEGEDKPVAEKRALNKPPGIVVNVDNGSHRRRSVKMGNSSHSNAKMVKRVHKAAGIERKYGAGGK